MKMFKRTLAMLLCAVMALGLMAVIASAAGTALIDTTKNICPTVSPASTMNSYARRSDTLFRSIVCRINAIALLSRIV